MTVKKIKNEQWPVRELISKIDNKDIVKPKFQRKKNGIFFLKKIALQMKRHILNSYTILKIAFMQLHLDRNLILMV